MNTDTKTMTSEDAIALQSWIFENHHAQMKLCAELSAKRSELEWSLAGADQARKSGDYSSAYFIALARRDIAIQIRISELQREIAISEETLREPLRSMDEYRASRASSEELSDLAHRWVALVFSRPGAFDVQ